MEKWVLIEGNQGNTQCLTGMNFHLWSNDSLTLYCDKSNFENYGTHSLNANIIYESKKDGSRFKLPQKRSHDFHAIEEEESKQSYKPSLKSANKNIYLEFSAADSHYILRELNELHEIKMKNYASSQKHSPVLPFYNSNTQTATDSYMNNVVKYDGNSIRGESKPNFSYVYRPNKPLNILNSVISNDSKFDPILCTLDDGSFNDTEKICVLKNYGKTVVPMCYLEAVSNRLYNGLFPESIKLTSIEIMQTTFTNAIIHNNKFSRINLPTANYLSKFVDLHNNKILRINLPTANYSSKFADLYDRNIIIKSKKITPKLNHNKTIKFSGLARKLHNASNSVKLTGTIHFYNLEDNFPNSVMCYSNYQARKPILQCNYKPNYLNMRNKALSHYSLDFGNILKYNTCVKKAVIKVTFPNCENYSGELTKVRNNFQISTVQLYDKLSESIKCLHERLESPNQFFAVKHSRAASIKKELAHQRFIKQTHTSYGNESCVSKADCTQLHYITQKWISAFKHSFIINQKNGGKQTNKYDSSVMSMSTQTDATTTRKVSKKTVGSQTSLSHMTCCYSEKRSNVFSNASYKRKIEALNLETLPSKKVFTYKCINSDSISTESRKPREEINTDECSKQKINNYRRPFNEESKSDSVCKLRPVAKKSVFQYPVIIESKISHSHVASPSQGNSCRRGIRLGLSKKVRPGRKSDM